MMTEPTIDKLRALKLFAMITAWMAQREDPSLAELSFDERLALLVDAETLARDNKRLARLLHGAKLRIPTACLEDLDLGAKRGLDRPLIRSLSTGRWVLDHQNILITGMTGVGKSFLACALGQLACRQGHKVLWRERLQKVQGTRASHAA
ncbi:MAG: ATP-binding protein [Myxococcales bacterium]|nr:ATP-binding protein [Myxococcales bacterium]